MLPGLASQKPLLYAGIRSSNLGGPLINEHIVKDFLPHVKYASEQYRKSFYKKRGPISRGDIKRSHFQSFPFPSSSQGLLFYSSLVCYSFLFFAALSWFRKRCTSGWGLPRPCWQGQASFTMIQWAVTWGGIGSPGRRFPEILG